MQAPVPPARLQALSRAFRVLIDAALVVSVLVLAAVVAFGSFDSERVAVNISGHGPAWFNLVAALVVGGLVIVALLQLRAMLVRITQGDLFGPRVRRALSRAAGAMLAACVLGLLVPPLGLLLRDDGTPLSLTLRGADGIWLLTALMFFFVSRWIEAAAAYEADSREIV